MLYRPSKETDCDRAFESRTLCETRQAARTSHQVRHNLIHRTWPPRAARAPPTDEARGLKADTAALLTSLMVDGEPNSFQRQAETSKPSRWDRSRLKKD